MKKHLLLICAFSLFSKFSLATVITIVNSGLTFSPSTVTVTTADQITFSLGGAHNAVEVSQSTFNAGGTTALPGGFSVAFGGGTVAPGTLSVGVHYYVCTNHAGSGMKGTITVQSATGIGEAAVAVGFNVFPNNGNGLVQMKNCLASGYPTSRIEVFSQDGRMILQTVVNSNDAEIDLSKNASGYYFIRNSAGDALTEVRYYKN